ncbi:porin [Comamonadaceae bacterium M7527]|nr:porin [Comamonadaceae bacterium M7527]
MVVIFLGVYIISTRYHLQHATADALAAVAVAGVASAQVTMSGSVAFGYSVSDDASGFGTDDASLKFATSEDLGGGLKLSASFGIDGIIETTDGTTSPMANGNNITLAGGFGTVSMNTGVGGDAVALDQVMSLGNGTVGSTIGYTAPAFGPVTLSFTRKSGDAELGKGAGGSNASINIFAAKYAAGPVAAGISALSWNDSTSAADARTVLTASYDLGVAKVGVFYGKQSYTAAGTADLKNTAIQISAPVGPFAVSYERGSAKGGPTTGTGAIAAGQTNKGNSLTVSYALSKRTALTAKTEKWDTSATATSKASCCCLTLSNLTLALAS